MQTSQKSVLPSFDLALSRMWLVAASSTISRTATSLTCGYVMTGAAASLVVPHGNRKRPLAWFYRSRAGSGGNLLDEGGNESEASNAQQACFTATQAQVQVTAC
jgi:hypothetical protein